MNKELDTKTNCLNLTKKNLDNLIYYNIVFHYHNEPIELIKYYFENLNFLFNNMIKNDNVQVIFSVNFFVSNLKDFLLSLKNINYIHDSNYVFNKHIIYENDTNYITTKYVKLKLKKYDFYVNIHEIIAKPNKNILSNDYNNIYTCNKKNIKFRCDFENKIKIDDDEIIDGSKSIGFKRYVANIMSWNIYEKYTNGNKQEKIFNQIKIFLFQIDFGTIIGLHILLHNSTNIDLLDDNNLISPSNFNYWYETKQFLLSNKSISKCYSINDDYNNETLYSNYDFYYFVLTHLITVIQNFNIVHFTALSIKKSKKYKLNNTIINSIPNKPINYFNEYYKVNKSHYDKFYITDISLTYLYEYNISRPITYNKNYTSFSEDLLYTSLLYKLKKLIIPHPFLNTTKCSYKFKNEQIKTKNKNELIYIFLPLDDVGNNKIFDLLNYVEGTKHNVKPEYQDDEINELKNNFKLHFINKNLIQHDDFYNDVKISKTKLIDTDKIVCNIGNKTNTKLYITKYSNSKNLFNDFNKIINEKFNNLILLNYENLLVVFDSNTNLNNYNKIISKSKNNKIIDYYNDEYNFYNNSKYKILSSAIILKYSNNNLLNLISDFVLDYTLNFLEIKKISVKFTNEIITKTIEKISSDVKEKFYENKEINDEIKGINYEKKYLKYKLKYLKLKKFDFNL